MVLEQVDIQWQKKKTTDIISHHTQNFTQDGSRIKM